MTLWGCRLGTGFVTCAAARYSLAQGIIVAVIALVAAVTLSRLLDWLISRP